MKIRDLKHGDGDILHSWPPMWGGSIGPRSKVPLGAVGKLVKVERIKVGQRGVEVHIEYEGGAYSGFLLWNSETPSIQRVLDVLGRHVGEDLAGLGAAELD
jgi:hypothetical protein